LIAQKIVASATRRGYAGNGQLTVFSTVSIFDHTGCDWSARYPLVVGNERCGPRSCIIEASSPNDERGLPVFDLFRAARARIDVAPAPLFQGGLDLEPHRVVDLIDGGLPPYSLPPPSPPPCAVRHRIGGSAARASYEWMKHFQIVSASLASLEKLPV
jgi:hypothetical protein